MGCWEHLDLKSYSSSCLACFESYGCQEKYRRCVWVCVRKRNAAACTWPSFLIWQRHQSLKVEATTLQEMQTLAELQVAEETLDILNLCRRTLFSPSLSMSFLSRRRARGRCGAETSPASRTVNSLQAN